MLTVIPLSAGYNQIIPAWEGNSNEIYQYNGYYYFIPVQNTDNIYLPLYQGYYYAIINLTLINNMNITFSTINNITLLNNNNSFIFGSQNYSSSNYQYLNTSIISTLTVYTNNQYTYININGILYQLSFSANYLILNGNGQAIFQYWYAYLPNNNQALNDLSEIIFLLLFLFIFVILTFVIISLTREE